MASMQKNFKTLSIYPSLETWGKCIDAKVKEGGI
jgi:hypothetical protein